MLLVLVWDWGGGNKVDGRLGRRRRGRWMASSVALFGSRNMHLMLSEFDPYLGYCLCRLEIGLLPLLLRTYSATAHHWTSGSKRGEGPHLGHLGVLGQVAELDGILWDLGAGSCDGETSGRCRLIGSRSDAGNSAVVWWWVEMHCLGKVGDDRPSRLEKMSRAEACKIQFFLRACLCSFDTYTGRNNDIHSALALSRRSEVSCHLVYFEATKLPG